MSQIFLGKTQRTPSGAHLVQPDHTFIVPAKLIKTPSDMKIWNKSEAYYEYLGFILAVNNAIKGRSNSQGSEKPTPAAIKIVGLLEKLDALIDETPPVQQPQRFGNVAFRTWYTKMRESSFVLLQDVLEGLYKAVTEVICYLVESFGNSTRIDYGTGHEISFLMFLCCLYKIGLLREPDKVATGCYIFPRYLDLVRKLQKTYRMEPAGSHGVWSLDDYQFVPFIWGSAQLIDHPVIEPSGFLNEHVLNTYGDDYMFLTCIQYINSVKTGPFAEHSNQLWSISGVSSWSKINAGLIKMYKAEVLNKFPVVQHIVFGTILTLKPIEQCPGMVPAKISLHPPAVPGTSSSTESSKSSESIKSKSVSSASSETNPSETSSTSSTQKSDRSDEPSEISSISERNEESNESVPLSSGGTGAPIPGDAYALEQAIFRGKSPSITPSEGRESVRFQIVEEDHGKKKASPKFSANS